MWAILDKPQAQSVLCLLYRLGDPKFGTNEGQKFSLLQKGQIFSRVHPASNSVDTRGTFLEYKAAGREADHTPLSSATVKIKWSYTSTSPLHLHDVHRDNSMFFLFTLQSNTCYVSEEDGAFASSRIHYGHS